MNVMLQLQSQAMADLTSKAVHGSRGIPDTDALSFQLQLQMQQQQLVAQLQMLQQQLMLTQGGATASSKAQGTNRCHLGWNSY